MKLLLLCWVMLWCVATANAAINQLQMGECLKQTNNQPSKHLSPSVRVSLFDLPSPIDCSSFPGSLTLKEEDGVLILDDSNFQQAMQVSTTQTQGWLLDFYAPVSLGLCLGLRTLC